MKIITVEWLETLRSGYCDADLRRWFGDGVTPQQVADLRFLSREIPVEFRSNILLRGGILPAASLHRLACRFAERSLLRDRRAGCEPDPASWAAVRVARRHAAGEATDLELTDAYALATSVAIGAHSASAHAAVAAAHSDPAHAAWTAATHAVWYDRQAAQAASRSFAAATTAERKWQFAQIRKALATAGEKP